MPRRTNSGLSPHRRNRRIALEKYGTRPDYPSNDFEICIEPELRKELRAELMAGRVRPSARRLGSIGQDRFLIALAKRGWPDGAAVIVYSDEPISSCRLLRKRNRT